MIEVGSNYFFKQFKDFKPKDLDYIELVDKPKHFKYVCHVRNNNTCIFYWRRMSVGEFIDYTINQCSPMSVGKFLIKEFCDEIGFKVSDLKLLENIFYKLDDKHKYLKVIFDLYIINNDFVLTNEQKQKAFAEYNKYR